MNNYSPYSNWIIFFFSEILDTILAHASAKFYLNCLGVRGSILAKRVQKLPKMAKNRENSMLFKMNSEENGKRNPKSDLIFGFTMKFYITYLPVFSTPLTFHA